MTREEKRILIAKDQGWTLRHEKGDHTCALISPAGSIELRSVSPPIGGDWWPQLAWALPNYFGCLNEMHKAENAFPHPSDFYQSTLAEVCGGKNRIYRATAAERAEAYGLARGLWKEGE